MGNLLSYGVRYQCSNEKQLCHYDGTHSWQSFLQEAPDKKDEDGNIVMDDDGNPVKAQETRDEMQQRGCEKGVMKFCCDPADGADAYKKCQSLGKNFDGVTFPRGTPAEPLQDCHSRMCGQPEPGSASPVECCSGGARGVACDEKYRNPQSELCQTTMKDYCMKGKNIHQYRCKPHRPSDYKEPNPMDRVREFEAMNREADDAKFTRIMMIVGIVGGLTFLTIVAILVFRMISKKNATGGGRKVRRVKR